MNEPVICPFNRPEPMLGKTVMASVDSDVALLFDALQDDVAIIDFQCAKVAWCSSTFSAHFPLVQMGTSLATLAQVFEGLADCLLGMPVNMKRATVHYEGDERLVIVLAPLDATRAVLRLENVAEHERVMQRHLEDREKLLFTSRAITVSEMATTLAHELNQPIGTITNFLSGVSLRLRRGEGGTSEILAALDSASDQARFAAKIITRVRDYTQSFQPQHAPVDLAELVKSSIALLDWEIQREGIVATYVDRGSTSLVVLGDEIMLQQVLVNLLRNAIDAMRGDSCGEKNIKVTTQHNDGQIEIGIADSGCGLTSVAEKNLFVPFISTKPSGMGVGLNICRSFIEMHQGRLWMSNNPNVGCTFHVALPVINQS